MGIYATRHSGRECPDPEAMDGNAKTGHKSSYTIFQSINEPEIGVRTCYRMVKNIKNYY